MSKQATDANADFVAALNALENVSANKSNPAFKGSKYVSLDQLLDAVKPVLAAHNLALCQIVDTTEDGRIGVRTSFRHRDGTLFPGGTLFIRADGMSPQQIGAALTYIRRQSVQTACCVSVDLDLDADPLVAFVRLRGRIDTVRGEQLPLHDDVRAGRAEVGGGARVLPVAAK